MMTGNSEWTIVIIDDEEDIRDILSLALKGAGYHVSMAANGESGLRLCEEKSPQIVITDIRMPGMDGLQLLETLKEKSPEIEVIVATAFGEIDVAIRALQLDASDFITKPINTRALHMALKRAQERFSDRRQLAEYTALLEKEKAETHQELIRTFAFQKNLIESSMDGILACNERGEVATFNKSMQELLGYTRDEVLHRMSFSQFLAPDEEKALKAALEEERFGGINRLNLYETSLLDRSGQEIPVQVSGVKLFDQERPEGFVLFFRDLRQLRKLEHEVANQARILHQDKMMSLGRLAASVVHEINNPLAGILNYVRLMARVINRGPLDEKQRKKFEDYLELVATETDRCSQIVSSLLTFSRKSPMAFEKISVPDLMQKSALLSRHKLELQNIKLEIDIQTPIPPIEGDFNQLQQCVINLIFNAMDAMPEGGSLTLSGHYDPEQGTVEVRVKDTGCGIAEKDLPNIFEPFFTTKEEGYGVGLGLSTVYGILERHRGTIKVESREGEGSLFTLQFPVAHGD